MKKDYGFSGTIIAFGLYGAFGLSFLFLLGTWLFAPTMFNDGQYGMSFMFTFPFGWLVGSIVGLCKASNGEETSRPHNPSLVASTLIAAGCLTLPVVGTMFMMLFLSLIGALIEVFKR